MAQFRSFRQFWIYYLQEHAQPGTRAMHYSGTSLVVLLALVLITTGRWSLLLMLPIAGYGFAWIGHALIEHNRPATFGYPLWSLRADFVLWYRFISGHMAHDLEQAGVRADGSIDPAKLIRRRLR